LRTVIVDYGMGNLRSIQKKVLIHDPNAIISGKSRDIFLAHRLILPGVGHFSKGISNIKTRGLLKPLNDRVVNNGIPVLGICLGMQLMANKSEEGNDNGLGWIKADAIKFKIEDTVKFKVPHIGWNSLSIKKKSELFRNIPSNALFYFIHSFYLECHNHDDIIAYTEYEASFASVIQKKNILGVQFHPEKSHDLGMALLENFFKNF